MTVMMPAATEISGRWGGQMLLSSCKMAGTLATQEGQNDKASLQTAGRGVSVLLLIAFTLSGSACDIPNEAAPMENPVIAVHCNCITYLIYMYDRAVGSVIIGHPDASEPQST